MSQLFALACRFRDPRPAVPGKQLKMIEEGYLPALLLAL